MASPDDGTDYESRLIRQRIREACGDLAPTHPPIGDQPAMPIPDPADPTTTCTGAPDCTVPVAEDGIDPVDGIDDDDWRERLARVTALRTAATILVPGDGPRAVYVEEIVRLADWIVTGQHLGTPLTVEPAVLRGVGEPLEFLKSLVDGPPLLAGAIVRAAVATIGGQREILGRADHDDASLPWMTMNGDSTWFDDADLSDVEVLFPGVRS